MHHQRTINLRVLVYRDDDEWVAHLLEMDLVGTGKTAKEAEDDLHDAFEAQITFCLQHEINPFRPAPPRLFKRWEDAQGASFERAIFPSKRPRKRHQPKTSFIEFSAEDRKRYRRRTPFVAA